MGVQFVSRELKFVGGGLVRFGSFWREFDSREDETVTRRQIGRLMDYKMERGI